jgi:UDP:flavonoid glycosyltransferase YjiC (YdhE family)
MERRDLAERQVTILNRMQEFRVGSAAGTEWFHRQRVAAALSQVVEKQSGQQGLADTRVGAGNEDDARQASSFHGRELTTDQAGWTWAN